MRARCERRRLSERKSADHAQIVFGDIRDGLRRGGGRGRAGRLYGPELEGFDYPFTVQRFNFPSQGQSLSMAFMDIAPDTPNGRTVVLLHGKNFCAATWEATIKALTGAGYRVVALDQIGFCKSTKPERYQYSFQQPAHNTHALLASRGTRGRRSWAIPWVECWPCAIP